MLTWIKKHKIITIIIIVAVLIAAKSLLFKDEAQGYVQETAEKRDIVTYNSFVGNVAPASDIELTAQTTEEVTEVLVKKGDKVKAGDIIAKLDTTTIDYNIKLQEANLKSAKQSNKYNISDAKRGYENYKDTIDQGLNASLESARTQMESAEKALEDTKEKYEEAKKTVEDGSHESIQSLYLQREQAYRAYDSARDTASDAYSYYREARDAYLAAQAAADAAAKAENSDLTNVEKLQDTASQLKSAMLSAETQMNSADRSVTNAKGSYDDACTAYNNAKKSILDNLEDAIESAQTSYDTAAKNFEITNLQVNQQLESYEAAYDKTKALSDVSAAEIQLAQLKASRDDYIIKAPASGTVTSLSLEKGETITMGMPMAEISDLEGMQVEIKVDEYTVKNVKISDPVKIYIDALEKEYEGTLVEVDKTATVEGGVSYFNAKVSFSPDEEVKSGMSVEVKVTRVNEPDTVSVTQNSLQYRDDNTAYIYVKDESGKLTEKTLTLGASDGVYVQVTEGLSEGDVIFYPQKFTFDMEDMDSMRDARNSMMLGE